MKKGKTKEVLINIRLKPETREEFRIAAALRGATMSGLLHQFIVRTIREERSREAEAFVRPETNHTKDLDFPSEKHFDPKLFPVQSDIYKRFQKKQKEISSNMTGSIDDNDVSPLKEPAHTKIIKRDISKRRSKGSKG